MAVTAERFLMKDNLGLSAAQVCTMRHDPCPNSLMFVSFALCAWCQMNVTFAAALPRVMVVFAVLGKGCFWVEKQSYLFILRVSLSVLCCEHYGMLWEMVGTIGFIIYSGRCLSQCQILPSLCSNAKSMSWLGP